MGRLAPSSGFWGDSRPQKQVIVAITTLPPFYEMEFSDAGLTYLCEPPARVQLEFVRAGVSRFSPWLFVDSVSWMLPVPAVNTGTNVIAHLHLYPGVVGTVAIEDEF